MGGDCVIFIEKVLLTMFAFNVHVYCNINSTPCFQGIWIQCFSDYNMYAGTHAGKIIPSRIYDSQCDVHFL